jgi:hypothetical protein
MSFVFVQISIYRKGWIVLCFEDLVEGEGIAGPDDVAMSTGILESCMGIAFVNKNQFGGLFHYPAECLDTHGKTILNMHNDIGATQIVLTPAPKPNENEEGTMWGSSEKDEEQVTEFLSENCKGAKVSIGDAINRTATLFWHNGKAQFNKEIPTSGCKYGNVEKEDRNEFNPNKRVRYENKVWYYGGEYQRPLFKPRKTKKGCFITSATCETLGLSDDCDVLMRLRWFRDKVMLSDTDGRHEVEEYYDTAPMIVAAIDARHDRRRIYEWIFWQYLRPAVAAIEQCDYKRARELYRVLVGRLQSAVNLRRD